MLLCAVKGRERVILEGSDSRVEYLSGTIGSVELHVVDRSPPPLATLSSVYSRSTRRLLQQRHHTASPPLLPPLPLPLLHSTQLSLTHNPFFCLTCSDCSIALLSWSPISPDRLLVSSTVVCAVSRSTALCRHG